MKKLKIIIKEVCPMANKYGQTFNFSGCDCANCAYSDPTDKREGKI